MHVNPGLALASAVIGFLVGLTGMGGGALMTPMLVLLFGVAPSAAISADLVAALFMKPLGVVVHWRRQSIEPRLVRHLAYGSVPAAIAGTYVMNRFAATRGTERHLQMILGVALIIGASTVLARALAGAREVPRRGRRVDRALVVGAGVLGGFMVGLTSVGAGSLITVMLLVLYPHLRADQVVGTDLAQSIPLTAAATLGTLLFGHVAFSLTASIIVGAVPAVVVGSLLSSRPIARSLRPYLAGVALVSGLKYVGVPPAGLGAGAALVVVTATVIARRAPRARTGAVADTTSTTATTATAATAATAADAAVAPWRARAQREV